jgi:CubicO group peptidase (beta-lactamase class C family)
MRTILCALWLGTLLFQPPSHAQGDWERYGEVAERRLDELGAPEMPGVAYAIVEQGEVSEIGATGVKRLGSDEPIGPDLSLRFESPRPAA